MGLSRVRGLVLERLGRGRAVLLTPDGQFVRVRLAGPGGAQAGDEAWGEPDARVVEILRRALGGWQRAAVATALAFGAAGAVFAAVHLRGWPAGSPAPSGAAAVVGEAVADAESAPAPPAGAGEPSSPQPAIHIVAYQEAPRLSVSVEWRQLATMSLRSPQPDEGDLGLAESLRRALLGGEREPASGAAAPGSPASRPSSGQGAGGAADMERSGVTAGGGRPGAEGGAVAVGAVSPARPTAAEALRGGQSDSIPLLRLRAEF